MIITKKNLDDALFIVEQYSVKSMTVIRTHGVWIVTVELNQ